MGQVYLTSIGATKGILIMWDTRVAEFIKGVYWKLDNGFFFLFKNILVGFSWAFFGVYRPNVDINRKDLWDELASLASWWNIP